MNERAPWPPARPEAPDLRRPSVRCSRHALVEADARCAGCALALLAETTFARKDEQDELVIRRSQLEEIRAMLGLPTRAGHREVVLALAAMGAPGPLPERYK